MNYIQKHTYTTCTHTYITHVHPYIHTYIQNSHTQPYIRTYIAKHNISYTQSTLYIYTYITFIHNMRKQISYHTHIT